MPAIHAALKYGEIVAVGLKQPRFSMDQVQAWRNGADYKDARKIGDKYATFRSFAVPAAGQ